MNLNRKNLKKIMGLIAFTGLVCFVLMKFDLLCTAALFVLGILKPFIYGGIIAFVINIPMSFIEKIFFNRKKIPVQTASMEEIKEEAADRKAADRKLTAQESDIKKKSLIVRMQRPISLVLAIVSVILVLVIVIVTVIPQFISTARVLGREIPIFWIKMIDYMEVLFASNPELIKQLNQVQNLELDWKSIADTVYNFLKNGVGSMLNSTFSVAGSIVSGIVNFFIAFVFSFYVLIQKEKLGDQCRRIMRAYLKEGVYHYLLKVFHLLHHNFKHFITGQCTEAIILGTMFAVTMLICGFPYAVMVGVLIAFTALIPIVGAFIGCFIGAFLILVDSPSKVIWFLLLFIILQQIEGNLIYPHVVGNSVGLPSIWVLAAVSIGGSLMGVAGMLIFIPLLSTVYVLLKEDVNKRNKLGKKDNREKESRNESIRT